MHSGSWIQKLANAKLRMAPALEPRTSAVRVTSGPMAGAGAGGSTGSPALGMGGYKLLGSPAPVLLLPGVVAAGPC